MEGFRRAIKMGLYAFNTAFEARNVNFVDITLTKWHKPWVGEIYAEEYDKMMKTVRRRIVGTASSLKRKRNKEGKFV